MENPALAENSKIEAIFKLWVDVHGGGCVHGRGGPESRRFGADGRDLNPIFFSVIDRNFLAMTEILGPFGHNNDRRKLEFLKKCCRRRLHCCRMQGGDRLFFLEITT